MNPPRGKKFFPVQHPGSKIMLGLAAILAVSGGWLVTILPRQPVAGQTFWLGLVTVVLLGLAVYAVYRAVALFQLRYFMDRNGLQIHWGLLVYQVPLSAITAIGSAHTVLPLTWLGMAMPDWWVGRQGKTWFFATVPPSQSLLVQTATGDFVLSPNDHAAFIEAWQVRVPLGPTQLWQEGIVRQSILAHPLFTDLPGLRLAGGAILLNLILIGAVMAAYPAWPAVIPVQFNVWGQSTATAARESLLWLPLGGSIVLVFNLILGALWYTRDRLPAYLLWFVAILVQIGLWVGVRMVVG